MHFFICIASRNILRERVGTLTSVMRIEELFDPKKEKVMGFSCVSSFSKSLTQNFINTKKEKEKKTSRMK